MKDINQVTISSQIVNTMGINNDPWGVKDKNSCFIYGNLVLKSLKNFSDSFDFEGLYDDELPSSILFQPPIGIFTEREWDIIFLFLQKYKRKQIGIILSSQ
ncbi:hypothetical protein BB987_06010 [Photorhabdus temperata]|uniref:Uncharacterized protein n=1 Tax=Photorhabdus khanii NC19 TaxID=1004151 RepID=W3VBM8_9GAMM|nr:hypothetical protein PTE_00392 [Photorhabdus khanii NC19]OHV56140.1 hypothetical protein BB987_06010 [Photorhabdus temperata]